MKGRREARQKKWQGRRLTHMASVTTLLPAATGSSSINWQDIFHCTITSSGVSAKTAHHRHHNQHPSTHECICLNPQKTYFSCSKLHLECVLPVSCFFSFPLPPGLSPLSSTWTPVPAITPHFPSSVLFYRLLQTITEHKIAPTGTFLSLGLLQQGVSKTRLFSYMPSFLSQRSHGRRMTSTRLLKTVSADGHEKRGVNTLTLKNLHSLNNAL